MNSLSFTTLQGECAEGLKILPKRGNWGTMDNIEFYR